MTRAQKSVLLVLLLLLLVAIGAIFLTRDWATSARRLHADQVRAMHAAPQVVDTSALQTAQQLALLAVTPWEREDAQQALRLADQSVDLAFTAALDDAKENPAPLTAQTRPLAARVKDAEARLSADQDRVTQLTAALANARPAAKDKLQGELDLAKAQQGLDQDELDDAHQDLTRAGGDKLSQVQAQLDQHENSEAHTGKSPSPSPALAAGSSAASSPSPELTRAANLLAQLEAIFSLRTKESLLQQARQNALDRIAKHSAEHAAYQKQLSQEKAQNRILGRLTVAALSAKSATAPPSSVSNPPAGVSAPPVPPASTSAATTAAAASTGPTDATGASVSELEFLQHLSADQKILALYGKRIQAEQALATTYGNWLDLVIARKRAFLHGLLVSLLWIVLVVLFVFLVNAWLQRFFAGLSIDRRQMHTVRAVTMFAVQAIGIAVILLVVFGMPSNLATVLALAGAGITVAMKDFIVGFFGWFVLMGNNGIRPGDWVEINGVAGEVLQVGLLHTVILETGSWADAGHPTGRKVTFVNSFAIEGHYFNFSTSGQWLWDEIQLDVPPGKDPYAIADAIKKLAVDESKSNAALAEKEWERVAPAYAQKSFSADPSLSVTPSGVGVNVRVRYITRANERHEVRERLYRGVVDLLRDEKTPETAAATPST
ncbi:MAG: mechanosensitive ion channel domain-containing protein [Candidatus Acidiferrales bacterium]